MRLYLIESPKDFRTWAYPTFNTLYHTADFISMNTLEVNEDENGEIYIEQYTDSQSERASHLRVSGSGQKSIHSDWLKRFRVEKNETISL